MPASPRPPHQFKLMTLPWIFLGASYVVLGALLFALHAWADRQRSIEQGQERLETLAVALAANAEAVLQSGQIALQGIELAIQAEGGLSGIGAPRLRALLRDGVGASEGDALNAGSAFYSAWATNAQGEIVASSLDVGETRAEVSGRAYFAFHRDHAGRAPMLNPLVISKLSAQPCLMLTMRLQDGAGHFQGVLGVAVRARYFEALYGALRLPPGSAILLLRDDGQLLFRHPFDPAYLSLRLGEQPEFIQQQRQRQAQGSLAMATSPFDHELRIAGFKRGQRFPLIAVASETHDGVLAQWRRNTATYAAIGLGAAGLAALLLWIAMRQTLRLSIAVENSLHDPLTGLPNRRFLDSQLAIEWARLSSGNRTLALLFVDVDHFKLYNDCYGHELGDHCLDAIGRRMRESLRQPTDMLARYGGEEFVVLLPDTDGDGCARVAQSLIDAVAELDIPHAASPLGPRVTISIGMACLQPGKNGAMRDLLRSADQALYRAKQLGRARAVAA